MDPGGTAVSAAGWLLVDWPLPWPRDVADVVELLPIRQVLQGTGIRVQLVVPAAGSPTRDVVLHAPRAREGGWFGGYERVARRVDPGDVVAAALDLVTTRSGDRTPSTDVLVCGHGSRDRCCGALGTSLAVQAGASGVEVRRTSHTGGHRLAPTGIVLPQGTSWAFLDEEALGRIGGHTGEHMDLVPRYRGCTGLDSSTVQAAERVPFAELGWPWFGWWRRGFDVGDGRVVIEGVSSSGEERSWEVQVRLGRLLPVPDCGRPPQEAVKAEQELIVRTGAHLHR